MFSFRTDWKWLKTKKCVRVRKSFPGEAPKVIRLSTIIAAKPLGEQLTNQYKHSLRVGFLCTAWRKNLDSEPRRLSRRIFRRMLGTWSGKELSPFRVFGQCSEHVRIHEDCRIHHKRKRCATSKPRLNSVSKVRRSLCS